MPQFRGQPPNSVVRCALIKISGNTRNVPGEFGDCPRSLFLAQDLLVLLPGPQQTQSSEFERRLMSSSNPEDLKNEVERLRAENERLKKSSSRGISLKVSEKGGVSVYGLGRFPVTLYKEQWKKLLDMSDDIRNFIEANDSQLKTKE
jgi:hypothetical protein